MNVVKEIIKKVSNADTLEKFDLFYEIHREAQINLTTIKDYETFYVKHYLDSLLIFYLCDFVFDSVMDIGSGGGFPGIPIAMAFPEKKVYLVESIRKKADFLKLAKEKLGLDNVYVINERCEKISNLKVDLITARGVAEIKKLLKWTKNVSRETSIHLFYKGENLSDELKKAKDLIVKRELSYETIRIEKYIKRSYVVFFGIRNRVCCSDERKQNFL